MQHTITFILGKELRLDIPLNISDEETASLKKQLSELKEVGVISDMPSEAFENNIPLVYTWGGKGMYATFNPETNEFSQYEVK